MAQKQTSRFPLNEKFSGLSGLSGLSGHVPNYDYYGHLAFYDERNFLK